MERRSLNTTWRGLAIGLATAGAILLTGSTLPAQTPAINAAPPAQAPAQTFAPQQLDNLVGPIALYPDPLLGQVLAASTYPVELMEAQQWVQANPNLRGQQLMDAARAQNWDPSVQALVAMPDVLSLLTQDIRWTTDLGNAFLAQQGDVMSAVQRMRQTAQANGQLKTTPQETVSTEDQNGQQAIEIEPANPQVIYVPEYDPYYVYGWGNYPPLYYPDGYWFGSGIDIGFYFGGWGGWGFGGLGWGWGPNWFGRGLYVNTGFFNRYGFRHPYGFAGGIGGREAWEHDPAHRLGAVYPRGAVANRFGAASTASRLAEGRAGNWRGFEGNSAAVRGQGFQNSTAQRFSANSQRFSANSQRFEGNAQRFSSTPNQQSRGTQSFRSAPAQRYSTPAQRYSAPAQRYSAPMQQQRSAPAQRYSAPMQQRSAPAQRYSAPMQQRSAPAQHYSAPMQQRSAPAFSAPQRSFQSAPRMSAPSFGGGGGARSFGGGGGVSRSSGGGGFRSSGGGGGHGGGRR